MMKGKFKFDYSDDYDFSPLSTFDRTLKQPINQSELNSIKVQADIILKNIENQIQQCQKIKQMQEKSIGSQTYTGNYQRLMQQNRPITGNRTAKTPQVREVRQRPITGILQEKSLKEPPKRLEMNQLCTQEQSMGNYKLDQILGSGSYATVRLSTDKHSKEKFAIKIYDKLKLNDAQKMNNVKREISLLKRIDHPNIIRLICAIEDRKSINLVMEYVSSTSLAGYLKSKSNRQLPSIESIQIFYQIAKAIKYLHDKNIAHRDIKLENILLNKEQVKLIDFGFSICMSEGQKVNVFCGTPSYMSPEIVSKTPHTPFSSDIWSLGILFTKILTGEFPFKGTNDKDLYRKIQCAKWKPPDNFYMDDGISRVIRGCLEKNSTNRWSIDQLVNDPIFK